MIKKQTSKGHKKTTTTTITTEQRTIHYKREALQCRVPKIPLNSQATVYSLQPIVYMHAKMKPMCNVQYKAWSWQRWESAICNIRHKIKNCWIHKSARNKCGWHNSHFVHFHGGFSVVKEAHSRKMQENLHERDGSYE